MLAVPNNMFGPLLNSLCQEFNFTIFDKAMLHKSLLHMLVMLITLVAELIIVCLPVQPTPQ